LVIWLIGLAGSGKTSVGRALYNEWKTHCPATVFIDGDQIRELTGNDLGFDIDSRQANGWRICRLCKMLDSQKINVVCATLSQFQEQQDWNRENYSDYFELYLDVNMDVLKIRDQKGLYSGFSKGEVKNVVGLDMPFEPPQKPDMIIENSTPRKDFDEIAKKIFDRAQKKRNATS
jgi:adenylylsulfate kinase-like enzyme